MPDVYGFLEKFVLTDEELADLIGTIAEGDDEFEAAKEWMNDNEDVVSQWIE